MSHTDLWLTSVWSIGWSGTGVEAPARRAVGATWGALERGAHVRPDPCQLCSKRHPHRSWSGQIWSGFPFEFGRHRGNIGRLRAEFGRHRPKSPNVLSTSGQLRPKSRASAGVRSATLWCRVAFGRTRKPTLSRIWPILTGVCVELESGPKSTTIGAKSTKFGAHTGTLFTPERLSGNAAHLLVRATHREGKGGTSL